MKKVVISLMVASIALSSCSVVMAAKKEGVSIEKVQSAKTRSQFFAATNPYLLRCDTNEQGQHVEIYRLQKERGSAARAFMHGCLDVATFGVWEVVGTPIEGCSNQAEFYVVKITYDDNEVIQHVELL